MKRARATIAHPRPGGGPIYRRIADSLRSKISRAELRPGDRIPTAAVIARAEGVSLLTANQAVKLLVEEGLVARRPRLGSFVAGTLSAASLPKIRSIRVVLCRIGASDVYWLEVLRAIEAGCRQRDIGVSLLEVGIGEEADAARLAGGADGLVMCGYNSGAIAESLLRAGTPFGLIGDMDLAGAAPDGVDIIAHDELGRATASVEYLIDLGHRDIACVVGPGGSRLAHDIVAGARQACAERGLSRARLREVAVGDHTFEAGRMAGAQIMGDTKKMPSAVFACDDRVAVGIVQEAADRGIDVPGRLSVMGRGGLDIGKAVRPMLTTTPSYPAQSARMCLERMLARIDGGGEPPRRIAVAVDEIITRGSTAAKRA